MRTFSTAVTHLLDFQAASERALVLHALGIDSAIVELDGKHVVAVAAEDGPRARAEIDKYDRENPPSVVSQDASPPMSWGLAAAAVYAAVLAVFWRAGAYDAGRADAAAIRAGAWWRAVTALTLHADLPHIAGNLLFGSIFGIMLAESAGFGVAWLGFVLTGALGNLANAWIQPPTHLAVGASTGIFGMLGMQVAFDAVRRRSPLGRIRRWAPFAVGAGMLAWLGGGRPGEPIDVGAHVLGFLAGLALGTLLGRPALRIPRTAAVQGSIGIAAIALVAATWYLASP
ncbi:MAG TPA: rhomboid family intramembrane serine protease [Candidatus Bathyarchaeia archaeon]|nr:rhomboid family intramembrane serine protease [Candidatus Bathyarchaeia archaeon]